jgi:phage baseplate assembly protein V
LPDIDEHVICIFLPNGNAQGFCIGAFYSAEDTPPISNPDKRLIQFADGSSVEHDRSSSTMTIDCKGPIIIKAAGNVTVTGDVTANGISLVNHTHPDPQGGTVGKPQ